MRSPRSAVPACLWAPNFLQCSIGDSNPLAFAKQIPGHCVPWIKSIKNRSPVSPKERLHRRVRNQCILPLIVYGFRTWTKHATNSTGKQGYVAYLHLPIINNCKLNLSFQSAHAFVIVWCARETVQRIKWRNYFTTHITLFLAVCLLLFRHSA